MKITAELEEMANSIRAGFTLRCESLTTHTKLLRSIQVDALRKAQEIVEKHGDNDLGHAGCLDEMTKLINGLELQ